jgi:hypothetical protein
MSTPAIYPQITCNLTTPRGLLKDYAPFIPRDGGGGTLSVTQNFGRQGDTASIPLVDANYSRGVPPNFTVKPTFWIPAFSTVELFDVNAANHYGSQGRATFFTGYVNNPTLSITSPTQAEWGLSCIDYAGYANASVVQGLFEGIHMGDAIVHLVRRANCGITAATEQNGGYVQLGKPLPRTVINYTNLTQALQKISKMASSQSAYGWYVDEKLRLHFYNQQSANSSGVIVTDSPTQSGLFSYSECHIVQGSLTYNYDGSSLFNRALAVGDHRNMPANHKKAPTDTWTADGKSISFHLRRVPVSNAGLLLTMNGIKQSVDIYNGATKPTTDWYIDQNSNGTWDLISQKKTPVAGSVLKIWYDYRITVTAQADLKQSQNAIGGPNKGVFATVINQRNLQTTTAAHQRAVRELAEFGHPQEKISFSTSPEWVGIWRAGETFILDSKFILDSRRNFAPGLHAKFLITSQTISFDSSGYRSSSVEAVRVG